jgi:hypothetical protein
MYTHVNKCKNDKRKREKEAMKGNRECGVRDPLRKAEWSTHVEFEKVPGPTGVPL